jgi:isochorismate hydrolase
MKTKYFSPETIDTKSKGFMKRIKSFKKETRVTFSPKKSALLILDMQRFFLEGDSHAFVPSAGAIVPKIAKLSNLFHQWELPVIATRHVNSNDDAKMMSVWWRDILRGKNELSEIIKELDFPYTAVVEKPQYDAFYQTNLEDLLIKSGVSQVVVTGLMTHLCVETTARNAFVRGFEVIIPIDGTATYNEDFHLSTFVNLSHGFAVPALMDDLIEKMENNKNEG